MIYILLFLGQVVPNTDLEVSHYTSTNVGGMQVTATDATINLQCQCFCSTPPVTRLEDLRDRIVAAWKMLWRLADMNDDGAVDLREFQRVQLSGGQR